MHLASQPFEQMRSGKKKFELRLYDEKRQAIDLGDQIAFIHLQDPTQSITVKVVSLHRYPTFKQLAQDLDPQLAGASSSEELCAVMRKYYSAKDEDEHTVLGIGVEVV